jgi:hypothetical protein
MKLFVFSSTSVENIRIGVQAGTWAIRQPQDDGSLRRYITKASEVEAGSFGVFTFDNSPITKLTTPFVILSPPDPKAADPKLWSGARWVLPFRIRALGDPNVRWSLRDARRSLPSFRDKRGSTGKLFKHMHQFNPVYITEADWGMLVETLCMPMSDQIMLVRRRIPLRPKSLLHLSSTAASTEDARSH